MLEIIKLDVVISFILGSIITPFFISFFKESGKSFFHWINKTPTSKDLEELKKLEEYYSSFKNSIFYNNPITKNHIAFSSLYDFIHSIKELKFISSRYKKIINNILGESYKLHDNILKHYMNEDGNSDWYLRNQIQDFEKAYEVSRELELDRYKFLENLEMKILEIQSHIYKKKNLNK